MTVTIGGGAGGGDADGAAVTWRWPVTRATVDVGGTTGHFSDSQLTGSLRSLPVNYARGAGSPHLDLVGRGDGRPLGFRTGGTNLQDIWSTMAWIWAPLGYPTGTVIRGAAEIALGLTPSIADPHGCGILRVGETTAPIGPADAGGIWVQRGPTVWQLSAWRGDGGGTPSAQVQMATTADVAVLIWEILPMPGPTAPATITGRLVSAGQDVAWGPWPWDGATLPEMPPPVPGPLTTMAPSSTPICVGWHQRSPAGTAEPVITAGRVDFAPLR